MKPVHSLMLNYYLLLVLCMRDPHPHFDVENMPKLKI